MSESRNPLYNTARTAYKDMTLKHLYPARYRAAAKKPVDPRSVVFLEIREKTLSDNFRLIRAALEKRNERAQASESIRAEEDGAEKARNLAEQYKISFVPIREGMEGQAAVMKNCLAAIPVLATAHFIFVSESSYFLSSLPVRPETIVIQTWHACGAFKRFGYSAVGRGFGTTREDLERYPVHGNFSYVTVSSKEVVWAYAEAFHMEDRAENILPVGISRTDMFFSRKFRQRAGEKAAWVLKRMAPELFPGRRDIYSDKTADAEDVPYGAGTADHVVIKGRKIILYAPTFRGPVAHASSPDRLDIRLLKEAFGKTHVLFVNHHPFVKENNRPEIPQDCRDFAFDMTGKLSIEELLTVADVCVTDYSSLIFEYSLFERPMIFYAFDMDEYLDERGFYYPVRDMMPGPVCGTTEEVVTALSKTDDDFDLARVREFKYRFMDACDGHATQRILRLMDMEEGRKPTQ